MKITKLLKDNYKIIICILLFIMLILYIIFSYNGIFIFHEGFNELDYVIFTIIGDSILVGITTFIATRYVSLFISKKEFNRTNKINVNILERNNSLYNFSKFMEIYNESNYYFGLNFEDRKVFDYVYKKYLIFDAILNKEYINDKILENAMNYPFIRNYMFKEEKDQKFKNVWQEMNKILATGKSKANINLFQTLINDEDYDYFEKFSNIISKIKYFEIVNLNPNEGCVLLVTADNQVINKISCLPNSTYGFYLYFDDDKWIQFIGFTNDYDGKEEATNLVGFKYTNKVLELEPAHITLSDYIKVNKK